jgi:hypothetical protein
MQILMTSLWARRLVLYFSLGAGVIVILHVVFSYFGFLHTDVDSARYMLSALAQSEAAIGACCYFEPGGGAACRAVVFGKGDRCIQEDAGSYHRFR